MLAPNNFLTVLTLEALLKAPSTKPSCLTPIAGMLCYHGKATGFLLLPFPPEGSPNSVRKRKHSSRTSASGCPVSSLLPHMPRSRGGHSTTTGLWLNSAVAPKASWVRHVRPANTVTWSGSLKLMMQLKVRPFRPSSIKSMHSATRGEIPVSHSFFLRRCRVLEDAHGRGLISRRTLNWSNRIKTFH